jgi:hypothetical protein
MSRTYRYRHLPKFTVKEQWSARRSRILEEKVVVVKSDWFTAYYFGIKTKIVKLITYVEWRELQSKEYLPPKNYTDGFKRRHPWIKWWKAPGAGIKKRLRKTGNRAYRHFCKQAINTQEWEDLVLPDLKDYVDWWDLY